MSYKNEDLLMVVNKYSKAASDAKAVLFETYDQLRDLTVSGPSIGGSGLGPIGSGLIKFAQLFSPSAFLPILGNGSINIPGTSFSSPLTGGNSIVPGGQAAYGFGDLGNYPGFPTGKAAAISNLALNSLYSLASHFPNNKRVPGLATGQAASIATSVGNFSGAAAGAGFGRNWVMPAAGIAAGIGGLITTIGPFLGPLGLAGSIGGLAVSGVSGAILNSYQSVSNKIIQNADTILSEKIRNIETVVKELDTQTGIIRKLLKEGLESDSKVLQNL